MGRVEMLLEKLMEKVDPSEVATNQCHGLASEPVDSLGIDVLTPSSTPSMSYENANAPILSLFDNAVFSRRTGDEPQVRNDSALYASSSPISSPQVNTPRTQAQLKLERLRRTLAAMLPSQHDVDFLSDASPGWWLIRRHVLPQLVR